MTRFFRALASALVVLVLAACAGTAERPDLARLYEADIANPQQPPVILIHGLMGSTLVERDGGREYWPGGLGSLAFSEYRELARMKAAEERGGGLVPGDLVYGFGVARVDFYRALLDTLETAGGFRRGTPGTPVTRDDRRRYYVLLYDWRKENLVAVRQLHDLIEQIRKDYADPDLPVDILAHSNGGLIANYYLRYGPKDVMSDRDYTNWDEGAHRIRRIVMLGAPSLGAVTSLERLQRGVALSWRTVPVEVLVTFATPFETLPHPQAQVVYSREGKPIPFDFWNADVWRVRRWSVFSPEVEARVLAAAPDRQTGELNMAELQAHFVRNLERARRFQEAINAPVRGNGVQVAVFGGDCGPTPGRAVLDIGPDGHERLVIRPDEVHSKVEGVDYERLLLLPGDGIVTRDSMLGRDLPEVFGRPSGVFPIAQSFFLCERHDQLSVNAYFQNNLLHFLLAR
jgi:pimeloyl-ACP methyl ester carboxylesterase